MTELVKNIFGFELQWWKPDEPDFIPEYMLKVIGITRENEFAAGEMEKAVSEALM